MQIAPVVPTLQSSLSAPLGIRSHEAPIMVTNVFAKHTKSPSLANERRIYGEWGVEATDTPHVVPTKYE